MNLKHWDIGYKQILHLIKNLVAWLEISLFPCKFLFFFLGILIFDNLDSLHQVIIGLTSLNQIIIILIHDFLFIFYRFSKWRLGISNLFKKNFVFLFYFDY
jgi:hypothetical protein